MARRTPEELARRAAAMAGQTPVPAPAPETLHRANDHSTSVEGARAVARRAPTQMLELLIQFREAAGEGLTDEEAGIRANLLGSCYWHRCTDLRSEGWIEHAPGDRKRKGMARVNRKVSVITEDGLAALARRGL